jgi:hypothetical protein
MMPLPSKLFALGGMMAALLLAGCATMSSNTIAGIKVPADSSVALFCTPTYPLDGLDTDGQFLDFLRSRGLTPTNKADTGFVVQIGLKQADPSTFVCTLVLLHGGQPVISASGTTGTKVKAEVDAPNPAEQLAADRASAFRAAAQIFEAKARGAS